MGLGSVLGYLAAGIVIGPVLGLIGSETQELQHFAEFGVVMMLFLIGLELEPKALWDMRHRLIGLGGLQVVVSTMALTAAAVLAGQPWTVGLAIGLALFAFTTILGWSYYSERCAEYLFGTGMILPFRIVWIVAIPAGAMLSLDFVWLLADVLNAMMAIPNLIALLVLSPLVFKLTKDYFNK